MVRPSYDKKPLVLPFEIHDSQKNNEIATISQNHLEEEFIDPQLFIAESTVKEQEYGPETSSQEVFNEL